MVALVLVVVLTTLSRNAISLQKETQEESVEGPVVSILGVTHLCFPQFREEINGVVYLCIPAWAFPPIPDEEAEQRL